MNKCIALLGVLFLLSSCGHVKMWDGEQHDGYVLIKQKNGATLGYSPSSGIQILTDKGYAFKDLNKNGSLDVYEDWRQPFDLRAKDLASQLSIEEIAGLMLYSDHNSIPMKRNDSLGYYGGKPFKESGVESSALSDAQIKFLKEDNLRHVLVTSVESPSVAAQWNNNVQAFVEGLNHGIPANNSSDPRHTAANDSEFNAGGGGEISMWCNTVGMAATFDPELVERFGQIASIEYRALGIATALSPQIDIATEPRWMRVSGTFGEDPALSIDMARAYCDGFQSTSAETEIADGWGYQSVNAMIKHWPGGGACEAGRDAHYGFGKFSVFPNDNIETHKLPFTEGAFNLSGKTKMASAVMPYYTITFGQGNEGENVGNAFSSEVIMNQLRKNAGFEGVICTDWGVTHDEMHVGIHSGKPWGVETLSVAQRHYKILMAGVDQFGGNNDKLPVLEAYQIGVQEHGEEFMRKRFEESAYRLLMNIFRVGLFENAYLSPDESAKIVGNPDFMKEAYEAQLKSIVMVKNHNNTLPMAKGKKVYIPKRVSPEYINFWGGKVNSRTYDPVAKKIVEQNFVVVDDPKDADFAIVFIESPNSSWGYQLEDAQNGGNGYFPISLQYGDYTAEYARETSIAGGDPFENFVNRTYKGKSVKTANKSDMESVIATKKAMGGKPVVVSLLMNNPTIVGEFEPYADAILVNFQVQAQAVMDIVAGQYEPSALLPLQMPMDMRTVEEQFEDTPRDMHCYKDSDGNVYDFAFGLNFKGVINDERVAKYSVKRLGK